MEAGKQRLSRDTTRDATRQEINALKRESADLKDLVADLSLDIHGLKKHRRRVYTKASPTHERRREGPGPSERFVIPRLQAQGSGRAWSIQERLLPLESQTRARKP